MRCPIAVVTHPLHGRAERFRYEGGRGRDGRVFVCVVGEGEGVSR